MAMNPSDSTPWPVADLAGFLAGDWRLERRIRDRLAGREGRFAGQARFAPSGTGLGWREDGMLEIGDWRGPAFREYRLEPEGPARMRVCFADGRAFHDLDLGAGAASFRHPCGADRYLGRARATGPDAWWLAWSVRGPRKALLLVTRYTRNT